MPPVPVWAAGRPACCADPVTGAGLAAGTNCTCLHTNRDVAYSVAAGNYAYFHWRLPDLSLIDVADADRPTATFTMSPCTAGHAHLLVNPGSPPLPTLASHLWGSASVTAALAAATTTSAAYPAALEAAGRVQTDLTAAAQSAVILLEHTDYFIGVLAVTDTTFRLSAAAPSALAYPAPGGGGLVTVTQVDTYEVEIEWQASTMPDMEYQVYYMRDPRTDGVDKSSCPAAKVVAAAEAKTQADADAIAKAAKAMAGGTSAPVVVAVGTAGGAGGGGTGGAAAATTGSAGSAAVVNSSQLAPSPSLGAAASTAGAPSPSPSSASSLMPSLGQYDCSLATPCKMVLDGVAAGSFNSGSDGSAGSPASPGFGKASVSHRGGLPMRHRVRDLALDGTYHFNVVVRSTVTGMEAPYEGTVGVLRYQRVETALPPWFVVLVVIASAGLVTAMVYLVSKARGSMRQAHKVADKSMISLLRRRIKARHAWMRDRPEVRRQEVESVLTSETMTLLKRAKKTVGDKRAKQAGAEKAKRARAFEAAKGKDMNFSGLGGSWVECSQSDGSRYYINTDTQEVTYNRPKVLPKYL